MYDGFIQRTQNGRYEGELNIDGVNISPIVGVYFVDNGVCYLWIKRKKILEYDMKFQKYTERERKPSWETYLKKEINKPYNYIGTFMFLRFKYQIYGIYDKNIAETKRLNLHVERMSIENQNIIVEINKIKTNG